MCGCVYCEVCEEVSLDGSLLMATTQSLSLKKDGGGGGETNT